MTKNFTLLLFILIITSFAVTYAQPSTAPNGVIRCYTVENEIERKQNNLTFQTDEQFERWISKEKTKVANSNKRATLYTIPIIFHVMHNGEAVGSGSNIDATYVNAQIDQLNNDFRRILGSSGEGAGVDTEIEFCAATLDPSDVELTEPGIRRIDVSGLGAGAQPYSTNEIESTLKAPVQWDPEKYCNIWVADIDGGILGYAQFPEAATLGGIGTGNGGANTDGVVVLYSSLGSTGTPFPGAAPYNKGRTLTHEIGHWLGLRHIWGDGNCSVDDFCADTPNAAGANYGCPNNDGCAGDGPDQVENYMDYTDDSCMNMFSQDQTDRMRIVMGETGVGSVRREILASSDRCGALVPRVNLALASSASSDEGTDCNVRTITFDVTMSRQPTANTNVSWTFGGTATNGNDYTVTGGTSHSFTTTNWSTPKTITVTIEQDAIVESDEAIVIDIASVTGSGTDAIVGNTNQITIPLDNDDFAPIAPGTIITETLFTEDWDGAGNVDAWTFDAPAAVRANFWYIEGNVCGEGITNNTAQIVNVKRDKGTWTLFCGYDSNAGAIDITGPTVLTTGHTNLRVEFDWMCLGSNDFGNVIYSMNNGGSWTVAGGNLSGQGSPTAASIAIPDGATNIGFRFTDDGSGTSTPGFNVDNIVLKGDKKTTVIQTGNNTGGGFAEHDLGPNETVYFYDIVTGDIMVKIENLTGHDYGCTKIEVDRTSDGTAGSFGSPNSDREDIADKTFLVTPQFNNASGSYIITLYYTKEEIDRWVGNNTNGEGLADLEMIKHTGSIAAAPSYEVALDAQSNFGTDYTFTATWSTGFSGFGLGDPAPPFPVEFVNFEATPNRSTIDLAWATASERNNKGFEVQRSIDARSGFATIGWVDGFGNTSDRQDYTFEDNTVRKGITYYYQLKQIDFDGSFEYSDVVSAQIVGKGIGVNMLPNPAKNAVAIVLSGDLSDDLTLTIMDIQGRIVETQAVAKDATRIDLDITAYSAGVYFVKINSATETVVSKLIVE